MQQLHDLKITLACGHTRESLPCWQAQDLSLVICKDQVLRTVRAANIKSPSPAMLMLRRILLVAKRAVAESYHVSFMPERLSFLHKEARWSNP